MSNFFIILFVSLTSCSSLVGPRPDGRYPILKKPLFFNASDKLIGRHDSTFDVHYYDLSLNIDPSNQRLTGSVEIHFVYKGSKAKVKVVKIDLDKRFIVNSIFLNNDTALYTREHNSIFITHEFEKDGSYIVTIAYEGIPQISKDPPWKEGFVWKKDSSAKDWVGVTCESTGAHIWWPVKDDTSDEPDSVKVELIVPKGLQGVSNGALIDQGHKGDSDFFTWMVRNPINVYNVTAYVGDFEKITIPYKSVNGHTYDLSFYVLPKNKSVALEHFKQTKTVLECFEKYFGEYPWWNDGFKMVESPFEGMEHQSAIAYGHGYIDSENNLGDYIIIHETAHEWWGNSLTAKDFRDAWLQEGFASYSESIFIEHLKSRNEGISYIYDTQYQYMRNRRPVLGPYGVHYFPYKDSDIYNKGVATLEALRLQMNDDSLFFDIIKTFATRFRKSTVETSDFLNLVNEKTGKYYNPLFSAYLTQRKPPKLKVVVKKRGKELALQWKRVPYGFEMPVYIFNSKSQELVVMGVTAEKLLFDQEFNNDYSILNYVGYYKLKPNRLSYFKR